MTKDEVVAAIYEGVRAYLQTKSIDAPVWADLTEAERAAIVATVPLKPPAAAASAADAGKTPVQYIGHRDVHRDTLYGTSLSWTAIGQTILVPTAAAKQMVTNHPDVYKLGEMFKAAPAAPASPKAAPEPEFKTVKEKRVEADRLEAEVAQEYRDQINAMEPEAIRQFVQDKFQVAIPKNVTKVETLRAKAIQLVDQYPVP